MGVELSSIAQLFPDFLPCFASDDADFIDAGPDDGFDAVANDGFVGHRQELLGPGVSDGAETATGAATEDEGFHIGSNIFRMVMGKQICDLNIKPVLEGLRSLPGCAVFGA